jgi:membrane protein DedA with SNARE-associated domain
MSSLLSIVGQFPYAGLFLLPILGSMGLPVPEDAILLLCGVLISRGSVAALPAVLAVYAGILLSDLLLYAVGRKYCGRILTHKIFRKMLSSRKRISLQQRFIRSGPIIILLCRQLFWLRAKMFLVAGMMKMPVRTFFLADAVAALLTMGIMVTLGYKGRTYMRWLGHSAIEIVPIALIIITAIAGGFFLCRLLARRTRKGTGELMAQEG